MNVLSLFDGISAGRLALQRANIGVNSYMRSEIDKYANQVAMHHFPGDVQLGDVTKWREWKIDWSSIDLLIGGSPCQGFSSAGKQGGTKAILNGQEYLVTSREMYLDLKAQNAEFLSQSHLFWEYVLVLDHVKQCNPKIKFLLENVKMKKELLAMFDNALGVESVVINSALVSAQNRVRHYWANWVITQPEDRGILLQNVLNHSDISENDSSVQDENRDPKILIVGGAIRGRNAGGGEQQGYKNGTSSIEQRLEIGKDEKTNSLTTVQRDSLVVYRNEPSPLATIDNESATKSSKAYTLTASYSGAVAWNSIQRKQRTMVPECRSDKKDPNVYNGIYYRKLTPTECARLQTFPDGWCENLVSKSQAYKAYGNSWTVDVIAHIFKQMSA